MSQGRAAAANLAGMAETDILAIAAAVGNPAGFSTGIHSSISSAARRLRQENRSSCQPSVRLAVGPWKATKPHRCWIAVYRLPQRLSGGLWTTGNNQGLFCWMA